MSEKPDRKSHAWTWAISVLAVSILYILSLGPLAYAESDPEFYSKHAHSVWLRVYWKPASWLVDNTVLEQPLESSFKWWHDLAVSRYRAPIHRGNGRPKLRNE